VSLPFQRNEENLQGSMLIPSPDFPTIDPAPSSAPQSILELRTALLNTSLPLFERYRAMFALRDFGAGSKDAVLALADGFKDVSALFRSVQVQPYCNHD
jgi:deoxyhypusine monooxygenase